MNSVLRSFAFVVGIPTLVAIIYFSTIASDMYVSETRFAIRANKSDGGGGLASLLGSSVMSAGGQDSQVVVDFIKSQDMLSKLIQKHDLVSHYSNEEIDFVSRLDSAASREDLLEHFAKHLEIVEDSTTDIIVLKVKAYSREYAKELAQSIITLSENLVNDLSTRIEMDAVDSSRKEVALAAEKVRMAGERVARFRTMNASINPAEETSALLVLLSGLESQLSVAKTELAEKRAYMKDNSPVVKSLRNKVVALQGQLSRERERVAGGDEQGMSGLISDYQPLALDQELAQQQYTSALTSLEMARIEAQRKKRYLITYVNPGLPDESTEPKRLMKILTVFLYSFLFFAIGGLLWSALKDHIGH